ncbi:MAG: hypothetical protein L3J28_05095 [Candidatus Polarisedimenticolaceae bacterium]|nr:hypothetical protein [Candidatus Polarisedimenticolaceae bacterium]
MKYPLLFRESSAVVLTKIDLLPHLTFDIAACRDNIKQVNAALPIFELSAKSTKGVSEFAQWLLDREWSKPS